MKKLHEFSYSWLVLKIYLHLLIIHLNEEDLSLLKLKETTKTKSLLLVNCALKNRIRICHWEKLYDGIESRIIRILCCLMLLWDDWMASRTRWTWVWVNSGRWWWTGRPGVLWSMGSQRVGHDWATELNWIK